MTAAEIVRRLDLEGLDITPERFEISLPPEVIISRQSQTVTADHIAARVKQQFLPALHWKEVQLDKLDLPEDILLPAGEVEWGFQCSPTRTLPGPYLNINFGVKGEVVKRAFLRTVLSIR